ncbi:MAG TPA: electron transfer flavoprotein subunit alpha/FixB family protein [Candidatus Bathyarchaeota archaeon]|nr:electron transfer flavoprotein subunit alpha/FixB family protein [Candidatus Bathyarchaeota archaeon]
MPKECGVLVFAEQEDGEVHKVTYELLGKGRELADRLEKKLCAVLLGYNLEDEAKELIYYGADKVYLFDHPSLREFDVIRYKQNIVDLIREIQPHIFLIGATRIGRSLAPRIAAALKTGLTADCVDLDLDEEGNLVQIRPAFSGNIMAQIKTRTKPQMATVRYKIMKPLNRDPERKGEIIRKEVEDMKETGIKVLDKLSAGEVNISEADVIVSAGRGLKSPRDFELMGELAALLEGVVGSSRPLVDMGWIGKEHQVGFSGNIVKPKVYMAFGISGSPQHLFGMRDSDIIIAVNKDPSAPIINVSDYYIIGDLYEILPQLICELKKVRGSKKA